MTTTGTLISEEAKALQPREAEEKPQEKRPTTATLQPHPERVQIDIRAAAKKLYDEFWSKQFKTSDGKHIWVVIFTHAGKTAERWFAHGPDARGAAEKGRGIVTQVTGNPNTSYTCAVEGRQEKAEKAAQRRDEILSKKVVTEPS